MNLSDKNISRYVFVFAVLYILLDAFLTAKEFYWLNLAPLAILFGYLLIFNFELYIYILLALVPVSIPLRFLVKGLSFDISLPAEILIVGGMIIFLLQVLYNRNYDNKILRHPVTIAIFLNLIWIFITAITSTMTLVSFKFLISRIWFLVIFYFVLILIFKIYKNFYIYLWCYVLPLIIVIFYSINRLSKEGIVHAVRAANYVVEPFFPDHTSYAAAIAMLLPVLIFLFFIRRKKNIFQKIFFISIVIIYFTALIFSYTRAAWLSLIIAVCFLFPALLKIKLRLVLFILITSLSLIAYNWKQIQVSLLRNRQDSSSSLMKHVRSFSNISTDASNLERINRWNSAIKMFEEKPFFGFGPNTYQFKYAAFQSSSDKTIISTNAGNLGNAHSEYLEPLSESGLFGMVSFLLIVLSTLFTASRVYFTSKRRKVKLLALSLMIGLISYDIHGIMNDFLDIDKINVLFWGFTAMIVALDVYHNNIKNKKSIIFY